MTGLRVVALLIALAVGIASWMLTCAAWRFDRVAGGVVPLDPRRFERLTLLTLGTGGESEDYNRRGPVTAVGLDDRVLLVDAGRSVAESLRAARIPVSQPDVLLLTSLLPENTLGLDDLLTMAWIDGRREPLRLYGPAGTDALARSVESAVHPGLAARASALGIEAALPHFDVEEIADAWEVRLGALGVRAGALPGGPTEAFAFRFQAGSRSAVVAGTGWAPDALVELAQRADLLVHEAVSLPPPELAEELGLEASPELLRRDAALHTALEDVGGIAERAQVGTLVLVRLRPPPVYALQISSVVDDTYSGRIAVASDGDEFSP